MDVQTLSLLHLLTPHHTLMAVWIETSRSVFRHGTSPFLGGMTRHQRTSASTCCHVFAQIRHVFNLLCCEVGVMLNCSEALGRETHDRQVATLMMEVATAFLVFMCRRNRTVSAKDRLYTVKANRKYLQYIRDSFSPTSLQIEGDCGTCYIGGVAHNSDIGPE